MYIYIYKQVNNYSKDISDNHISKLVAPTKKKEWIVADSHLADSWRSCEHPEHPAMPTNPPGQQRAEWAEWAGPQRPGCSTCDDLLGHKKQNWSKYICGMTRQSHP